MYDWYANPEPGNHFHEYTNQIFFRFFWMSTGKPITYENWNAGEPNNFQ